MLLHVPIYILITGKQGSGKSTLSAKLLKMINGTGTHGPRAIQEKFAGTLYACSNAIKQVLHDSRIPVSREQEKALLQVLGTEWGRKHLGEDVWVRALRGRVEASPVPGPFVLIDDCRFENEFRAFPPERTYHIRCLASEATRRGRCDGWRENTTHPSEVGLDRIPDAEFDVVAVTDKEMPGYLDPVSLARAILADLDRRYNQGVFHA